MSSASLKAEELNESVVKGVMLIAAKNGNSQI